MKNFKLSNLLILFVSFNIIAQEPVELTDDEIRTNEINELLELVKKNKSIYLNEDNQRLNTFINRVAERKALLADAKRKLENEKKRNVSLEASFEENEKLLADLEEKLEIKIGVLGELFGVTRQYAGELLASSENSVVFYEFPKRPEILKDIGQEQVHSLEQLENLWLSYFDEIVAGSEIKSFEANITNPGGDNLTGNVTGDVSGNITGSACTITTGNFTNVTIGGTLTYEDVTNIDSVGLITARSGVDFGSSGIVRIESVSSTKTSTSQASIDTFDAETWQSGSYQIQIRRGTSIGWPQTW